MNLYNFKKRLLELKFKELHKNHNRDDLSNEVYKRYCAEKGWIWAKKVDSQNLSLILETINKAYPNLSKKLKIRLIPNLNSFFSKIFFSIPDPTLEIYLKGKINTSITKIFYRKGRQIKIILNINSNFEKNFKTVQLLSQSWDFEIQSYLHKVSFYRNLSKLLFIKPILRIYKYILGPDKNKKFLRHLVKVIWPIIIRLPINNLANKIRFKKLSEKEFLSLKIIDKNPLNTLIRKAQFDRVTNGGKIEKISDLINFLRSHNGIPTILLGAKEPVETTLEDIPMHLNWQFWNNGDRYFVNCILVQFRKNVAPYSKLLDLQPPTHPFYCMKYYESLEIMTDTEIKKLLKSSPVSIRNDAFSGGRHKMFAMIGRMAFDKRYIPFWIDRFL